MIFLCQARIWKAFTALKYNFNKTVDFVLRVFLTNNKRTIALDSLSDFKVWYLQCECTNQIELTKQYAMRDVACDVMANRWWLAALLTDDDDDRPERYKLMLQGGRVFIIAYSLYL